MGLCMCIAPYTSKQGQTAVPQQVSNGVDSSAVGAPPNILSVIQLVAAMSSGRPRQ